MAGLGSDFQMDNLPPRLSKRLSIWTSRWTSSGLSTRQISAVFIGRMDKFNLAHFSRG